MTRSGAGEGNMMPPLIPAWSCYLQVDAVQDLLEGFTTLSIQRREEKKGKSNYVNR